MKRKHITILRGGPSEEYFVSLKTGAKVRATLEELGCRVTDVIISKQGEWLVAGQNKSPQQVISGTDLVFNALHGRFGEDGELQKILQSFNVPFTGSRAMPSAIAFNKQATKEYVSRYGILTPPYRQIRSEDAFRLGDIIAEITTSFGPEYVVKPVASGSSVGVMLVPAGHDLKAAIERSLLLYDNLIVEEYIRGKEATVAVMNSFRGQDTYVFPAIEIIPPRQADFFNTEAKYNGETEELCPGNFTFKERVALSEAATLIHNVIDLNQYSRSDFIVKNGQIWFLEVNTLPGLTAESLFPKAAAAVGLPYRELIRHLVETAR